MSFTSLDPTGLNRSALLNGTSTREEQAVRHAATEFEALLLSQLTASLNPTEEEEEDSLFSNSATGLYRQMFSEQMAKVMANQGGVGLADSVLHQLGLKTSANGAHGTHRAVEAARVVRGLGESSGSTDISANIPAAEPATPGLESLPSKLNAKLTIPNLLSNAARPHETASPRRETVETKPKTEPVTSRAARSSVKVTRAATDVEIEAPATVKTVGKPAARAAVSLEMPIKGRISSRFGERRDPIHGRHRHHSGVDIVAGRGTPIPAAAAGTVVFAGRRGGYGNLIEIEHADGRRTRYAHTDRILVAPGEQVESGQTIATVGSTGHSTGPHLHFEVRENGAGVDPLQIIAKDPSHSRR